MRIRFNGSLQLEKYFGTDPVTGLSVSFNSIGMEADVSEEKAIQLLCDFPGVFAEVNTEAKAPISPPEHKMIEAPIERKRGRPYGSR